MENDQHWNSLKFNTLLEGIGKLTCLTYDLLKVGSIGQSFCAGVGNWTSRSFEKLLPLIQKASSVLTDCLGVI